MDPYIGVTGFMSQAEVSAVLEVVPRGAAHKLMVGVLASWKTVSGRGNKHPGRYPTMADIGGIFVDDPRTINLVHYATDDVHTLPEQTEELERHIGPHHMGYQFNLCWPEPSIVSKSLRTDHRVVLQIGKAALAILNRDPQNLAEALDFYDGLITDVLIDPSGGEGKAFDPVVARERLRAIRDRHPRLGLGVAGRLSAKALYMVEPLIRLFPNLSIDAESRLRDPVDDHLDIAATREYVARAYRFFGY